MEETNTAASGIAIIFILLIFLTPFIFSWISKRKRKAAEKKMEEALDALKRAEEKRDEAIQLSASIEARYKPITDAEAHVRQLLDEAEKNAEEIKLNSDKLYLDADLALKAAQAEANKITETAKIRALEIAGEALAAKEKSEFYEATVQAMKNAIEGYKDDYIIPNYAVLDYLAEEFSHKEAGEQLKIARKHMRDMVKHGQAGECDYAEANRRAYAIHFAVDAFNGKVDSALAKVKQDNYGKIKQEIIDAFALVNHNGQPFRNARINQAFLGARLDELKWAVATYELRQKELEEQRAIREQMREEEKARRDIEKAIKDAEKEERLLQKALQAARKELAEAHGEEREKYQAQLIELEGKLMEAEARGQRAISMAQQTRRGHVYVISNIGSFGENVFKIGMTRRLEPNDRVKELSDASVPFDFDVHAMIYSEDAPSLEKELHQRFDGASINKVNPRKEFFGLNLTEIRQVVEQKGLNEIHWTMKSEAAEYRESLSIAQKQLKSVAAWQ